MEKIKVEQLHCGQYRSYGDFFRVWSLETEVEDKETILNYCFENLYKRRLPESIDYHRNIRFGGEKSGDANYYFEGYYQLDKCQTGWKFTVCEPYCD